MIANKTFWTDEEKAPIMTLNFGVITPDNIQDILKRTENWASLVLPKSVEPVPMLDVKPNKEDEIHRILLHDAERTFFNEDDRKLLFKVLNTVRTQNKDYAQGLSYGASFLLLTQEPDTVVQMLLQLSTQDKYIPGYWNAQATKCAIDSYVCCVYLMQQFAPDVCQHLLQCCVLPQAYAQKWFSGLCLHVLPFESLFTFWEKFLQDGYLFLMKFGISLAITLKTKFLATKDVSTLFGLLRLDPKYLKDYDLQQVGRDILKGTEQINLDGVDFATARQEMYDQYLKKSLEREKQDLGSDEIVFSDEEDEDDE